jgi:hypothetical protein
MTKQNFKQRSIKGIAIAICLAATTAFSACGDSGNGNDDNSGVVQLKINNIGNAGTFAQIYVYPTKPLDMYNRGNTIAISAGAMVDNNEAVEIVGNAFSEFSGGEGYVFLQFAVPVRNFITKNKVNLKKGMNTLDFAADFEIFYEFAGNGVITVTETETSKPAYIETIEIMDYAGFLETEEDILNAFHSKPLGCGEDPEHGMGSYRDWGLPVQGFKNQRWDDEADRWYYEPTDRRFDLSGTFFVRIRNYDGIYYASGVTFINGRATISWGQFKKWF